MSKPSKDTALTAVEAGDLATVGYGDERAHAATGIVIDQRVSHIAVNDDRVEILPMGEALRRYDWVQDLMFGLIDPQENEHVAQAAESRHAPVGHFVRVRAGAKVALPVQLFTLLETPQGRQFIHNITLIEEDAEVEMISGSAVPGSVHAGHHLSISETYLRDGARCRSVSIEHWGRAMEVHSYARSRIGRGARMVDSAVQLAPVRHHYAESRTLVDEDGFASDQSVIYAPAGTERIIDSEVRLDGRGAHAESITRMVTAGGSITNRARLIGNAHAVKGFLGCDGLKLNDDGEILSIPALHARRSDAQLSHEASVGVIAPDKLAYLMASGLDAEAARNLIVRGFLELDERMIPASLRQAVRAMVAQAKSGAM